MAAPHTLERLPIFPLRRAFAFPGLVTPLHIFEPRYREMVADALAGDHRIAIAHPDETQPPRTDGEPAVRAVCGVGEITRHEQLPDGRYNILLAGVGRARIEAELSTPRLYRAVRATWIDDARDAAAERMLCERVRQLALALLKHGERGPRDTVWAQLASERIGAELLSNVFPRLLFDDPAQHQAMLELASVSGRLAALADHLELRLIDAADGSAAT